MSASATSSSASLTIDPTGFAKLGPQLPLLADILAQSTEQLSLTLSATQQRQWRLSTARGQPLA